MVPVPEPLIDAPNLDEVPPRESVDSTTSRHWAAQEGAEQSPKAGSEPQSGRRQRKIRSALGTILLWVGGAVLAIAVLFILLPGLDNLAYRYLYLSMPESPTLILLSVTFVFFGYFLKNDPFHRAAIETREQVDSALRVGHGVAVNNSRVDNLSVTYPEGYDPVRDAIAQKIEQSDESLRRQENILAEIYTQGLIQAKQSFLISQAFAAVGATLIFVGVSVAFVSGANQGQTYASMITVVAGSVTSLVSALFITQSNAARKAMGAQGVMMREESTQDRQVNAVREMIAGISDVAERDRVQAQVAIQIIGMMSTTNRPQPEQGNPN